MSTPTAGEITVHQCVVRVVRRGGWSWGPDPRGLVQRVLDALPDLLAAAFDEYLTGDGPDLEITEPVRLSVRLSSRGGSVVTPHGLVLEAVPGEPVPDPVPTPLDSSKVDSQSQSPVPGTDWSPSTPVTVAALFDELAERDELAALLPLLPEETLRRYLSALLVGPAAAAQPGGAGIEPSAVRLVGPAAELTAELARRLSLPEPPVTRAELAELLGSPAAGPTEQPVAAQTARPEVAASTWSAGETRVSSVLPFLLVGPLARTGYLDAIGPALSGVDLLADASLFAAALAYKVLGAPERGWRRTPEDDAAAAAFAGCASVPDLTRFAQRVRPALPVLDGVLALSLCRGHDPVDPLLVAGVDGGVLLADAHGMFPVAWAPTAADLLPHWAASGRPPVLVCDSPLPSACLRDLATAGVPVLTDVRPLRDDPLSRLPWRVPLWTTGGVGTRWAAELPGLAGRLGELVRTLFVAHRAVPLAADRALDRGVALAASLSLGMIAWQLWRERETPDPVLALTRFADLEATVRYTPESVRVRIPLGRRHADLWRAGALTDVPNVVWLGGRTLTFSGG
ncbi:hypothetical protein [Actinophytocola sp.]|uniref:hypothetical protein n=1 Tax=Actinophytocola sp. TaxID=1872138 RepID=UPI00389A0E31